MCLAVSWALPAVHSAETVESQEHAYRASTTAAVEVAKLIVQAGALANA